MDLDERIMNNARKIVKEQKDKKDSLVKRKKILLGILKVLNRVELVFPIIMPVLCMGCVLYLFLFQENDSIARGLDILIAAMSSAVLFASIIHKKMTDRQKYMFMEPLYLCLVPSVLIVSMLVGIQIENASEIGRIISFACLCITIVQETKKVVLLNHEMHLKEEEKRKAQIEAIEKKSIMSSK